MLRTYRTGLFVAAVTLICATLGRSAFAQNESEGSEAPPPSDVPQGTVIIVLVPAGALIVPVPVDVPPSPPPSSGRAFPTPRPFVRPSLGKLSPPQSP